MTACLPLLQKCSPTGGQELEGGGVGGGSGDNDAVVHGSLLVELADELGDGGALLSHADVDAREGVGLGLLVDDGVHGDGTLAGLPIADDELALAVADGDERVHGLKASEHGLEHGLA